MSLALIDRQSAAPAVTVEELALVRDTVAKGATDAELQLYLYDCARQRVHPLDRLLHFTKRGNKYTPVTSIDLMRTRAADSGEYAGSDDAAFTGKQKADDWAATVTVWRIVQGQRCAFTATARWSEYKPDAAHMWARMPHTMLAKCAEALALRKGFPRQLAGLYAQEEMAQADRPSNGNGYAASGEPANGGAPPPAPARPEPVLDVVTGELVPATPAGFDSWWLDMVACADNGKAALDAAWAKSDRTFKEYALNQQRAAYSALRKKAAGQ